ncbi:MAG: hypothetical protein GX860_01665 [Alcaligenaceae bacterium]|jgi:tRNA nucleotidyltransferase (CCA-adding enzyme)|nr:hypothetical protein [Alcaligenaceae bacterium]
MNKSSLSTHHLDGAVIYAVGGAVRDQLLGLPAGDYDWVVVGATPEQMIANGYMPVGGDFPVFLHPQTREEYALARTERKSGRGYQGFTFYTGADVTLVQDLSRRDLTVNAMALRQEGQAFLDNKAAEIGSEVLRQQLMTGSLDSVLTEGEEPLLADPFNGLEDLRQKVFRHVSDAFVEDPVRILRLARFLARFEGFTVASETLLYCREMVSNGEVDHLVAERVWQELAKALMQVKPARSFEFLLEVGALERVLVGFVWTDEAAEAITLAAQKGLPQYFRYALVFYQVEDIKAFSQALRAPLVCQDAAVLMARWEQAMGTMGGKPGHDPEASLNAMLACDAIRKPQRFIELLQAYAVLLTVRGLDEQQIESDIKLWQDLFEAVSTVDVGAIARSCGAETSKIKETVYAARLDSLKSALARS